MNHLNHLNQLFRMIMDMPIVAFDSNHTYPHDSNEFINIVCLFLHRRSGFSSQISQSPSIFFLRHFVLEFNWFEYSGKPWIQDNRAFSYSILSAFFYPIKSAHHSAISSFCFWFVCIRPNVRNVLLIFVAFKHNYCSSWTGIKYGGVKRLMNGSQYF